MKPSIYRAIAERHKVNLVHLRWLTHIANRRRESFRKLLVDFMVENGLEETPDKLPVLGYGLEEVYLSYVDAFTKQKMMYDITYNAIMHSLGSHARTESTQQFVRDFLDLFLAGGPDEEE